MARNGRGYILKNTLFRRCTRSRNSRAQLGTNQRGTNYPKGEKGGGFPKVLNGTTHTWNFRGKDLKISNVTTKNAPADSMET